MKDMRVAKRCPRPFANSQWSTLRHAKTVSQFVCNSCVCSSCIFACDTSYEKKKKKKKKKREKKGEKKEKKKKREKKDER